MKTLRFPILIMLFGSFVLTIDGGVSFGARSRGWTGDHQPVVEWIAAHAVRLQTPEAGHGFADMQPLRKIVGDARIVSLGEATCGSREFQQLKHRMLEFLATEMGFTIFSIQANMPQAYRLNDFVTTGQGDPAKLLRDMHFWTWDTEEVLDMILWMRAFNQSGKGRVQFTGFDMEPPDVASRIVSDFVDGTDPDYTPTVRHSVDQIRKQKCETIPAVGQATATFPVKDAAGKRVRFSGYIKTEGVTTGSAGLWWCVYGKSGILGLDSMHSRGVTGSTDWKRYDIEIPVAAEARSIDFGVEFSGTGTAWFDGLSVELDGAPYSEKSDFDLDFESSSPRGFLTSFGYSMDVDSQVFHNGKHSLRISRAPEDLEKAAPARVISAGWRAIVRHMEASREAYAKKGASARDIEWAIQNARIVMQATQSRAKQMPYDRGLADNVKWILDNNRGAKIVLWTHNGHVSTASADGRDPMGALLRKVYGGQMVVFGFAFNQGSFHAIDESKGIVQDFTVTPAPAGSLDATFAATGIPLFALDLRDAPTTGPVAAWLSELHKSRSIDLFYSESTPAKSLVELRAAQSFDAMLFVEKTTAPRKNP